MSTILEHVKLLLGISDTSKDSLLTLLITNATEEAELYTHNSDTTELSSAIIQMVIYNYNRLGSEGLNSEGYAGVSFSYTSDYPDSIIRMLKAKRKVVVL